MPFVYIPEEVHVEYGCRHEAEEQIDKCRDKDSCQSASLYTLKVVPQLGKVSGWNCTVVFETLENT